MAEGFFLVVCYLYSTDEEPNFSHTILYVIRIEDDIA